MRLFLDTSVMLSAAASATGASREVFRLASINGWLLVTTHYAIDEVSRHLPDLPLQASADWAAMRPSILIMDDVLTINRPVVFSRAEGQTDPLWRTRLGRRAPHAGSCGLWRTAR